ncbi:MAG: AI-2E family transporter [Gemmataceae bacterium]
MINLNLSGATRWGLNALLILSLVVALYLGQTIFIPTVIALLLAAMVWPAATMLHQGWEIRGFALQGRFPFVYRKGMVQLRLSWDFTCMAMVGLLVCLTLVVPVILGLAIPKMLQDFPTDPEGQQNLYANLRSRLQDVSPVEFNDDYFPEKAERSRVFQTIRTALDPDKGIIINVLWTVARYGGSWIWQWILIMFILLFLLVEGRMLSRRVVGIFGPSPQVQAKALEALSDMASKVRTYLVWRTIVNFSLALILGIIYSWAGLRQPWTWAVVTAILCYIPYLGPIVAGILPVLDAFISSPSPWMAIGILFFYLLIITLEGYVIVPVVMGRPMHLNATTVLIACMFWELVWGTPGLFLAMPLLAVLKSICMHMPGWEPWANLMSTEDGEMPIPKESSLVLEDGLGDETQLLTSQEAAELSRLPRRPHETEVSL